MPLPVGTWKLNVNGIEADLLTEPVDEGKLFGSLLGGALFGFWDESSQTITFMLTSAAEAALGPALFKGYLFRTPPSPPPGLDVTATLTGFVQVPRLGGFLNSNSRRNVFGWMAQISEVQ